MAELRDVDAGVAGDVANPRFRTDQHRRQVAGERARKRELQRIAVAGIDERRGQRRQLANAFDERAEVRPRLVIEDSVANRRGRVNAVADERRAPMGSRRSGGAASRPGPGQTFPFQGTTSRST